MIRQALLFATGTIFFALWYQIFVADSSNFRNSETELDDSFHMNFTKFNETCQGYILPFNIALNASTTNLTNIEVLHCRSSGVLLALMLASFSIMLVTCLPNGTDCFCLTNRVAIIVKWIGPALVCGKLYSQVSGYGSKYINQLFPDLTAYVMLRDEYGNTSIFLRHALLAVEASVVLILVAILFNELFSSL